MKYFLILTFVSFTLNLNAQSDTNRLVLSKIMAGNDFIGHQPYNINWSPDNKTVYYRWQRQNNTVAPYYQTDINSNKPELIDNKNTIFKTINGFVGDKSGQHVYFKKNQSLYKWNENKPTLILKKSTNFNIIKVLDDNRIILKEKNNLVVYSISNGSYIQLIDFKEGTKYKNEKDKSYLENQQDDLFEIIKLNKSRQLAKEDFISEIKSTDIPIYYLNNKSLGWVKITPDLKYIIFRVDDYPSNEQTHIENHITANGYTKSTKARSKVGVKNPNHQLLIMNLETEKVVEIDITKIPNIYDLPHFISKAAIPKVTGSEELRKIIFTNAWISDENNNCIVEIKAYDNKTRWIVSIDLENGELNTENQQQNNAWIGGPGISGWNMVAGNIGWLNDNKTFYYQDEKSGYSHLYTHNIKTQKTIQLTKGTFEIHKANLSKDGSKFYISANLTHPGNREFYHLDIKSKKWTPILTDDGNYDVILSPNEKHLAVRYSFKNNPWELYLAENKKETKLTLITNSKTKEFKNYNWKTPEVITLKNEKGNDVYARIYRPKVTVKNGAAVQFVHGAGYLQNAHNWWSGYYREYMFNNLLCDLGYTVIDIDYRASKGYGRDFRTAIYQHMGGTDLEDQLIGRQYLIDNEGIDSTKIGIYGGSYGGFITIMALLTKPNEFKCGAAVRSVTDWAHYNHEYTSNILNTPERDSNAYKISSPIYFAEGLKNKLLILHGMVDDNVQFQDVVRLNQRFIELGKTNFQMALYPIEPHGFKETSSWVDEYTRILNLFNEELLGK